MSEMTAKSSLGNIDLKSHQCSVCSKIFVYQSALRAHSSAVHEGIKPYSCDLCDKKFAEKSSLNKHLLIHKGLKPHACGTCGKSFTQLSNLNKHSLIHRGIKPYSCRTCKKSFTQKSHLDQHLHTCKGVNYRPRKRNPKRVAKTLQTKDNSDHDDKNEKEQTNKESASEVNSVLPLPSAVKLKGKELRISKNANVNKGEIDAMMYCELGMEEEGVVDSEDSGLDTVAYREKVHSSEEETKVD